MDIKTLLGEATQLHNEFLDKLKQHAETTANPKPPSLDFLVVEKQKQITDMKAEVARVKKEHDVSLPLIKARIDELNVRQAALKTEHQVMKDILRKLKKQP